MSEGRDGRLGMADPVAEAREQAVRLLQNAYERAAAQGLLPAGAEIPVGVEIPRDGRQGDFASSFALAGAGALGMPPKRVARIVLDHLELDGSLFERAEAAGPGYLNLFCGPQWYWGVLSAIEEAPWGAAPKVSPLPRPPASLEAVRRRAWEDALSNLLEGAGGAAAPALSGLGRVVLLREGRPSDGGWAELGEDALRYFLTAQPAHRRVELDLDLALRRDGGNPLYKVQYSHARLCTLTARWGVGEIDASLGFDKDGQALVKALVQYPGRLRLAAAEGDPSRVNRYLTGLAEEFYRWYHAGQRSGTAGRLARCTRRVLADGLGLLGVAAPKEI